MTSKTAKQLVRGRQLAEEGQWPAARGAVFELVRQDPDNVELLCSFGQMLLQHRQLDAARTVLERAAALAPEQQESRILLAHCHLSLRQWRQARDAYAEILSRWPDQSLAHLGMSLALDQLGQAEKAEPHRRTAFARSPVLEFPGTGPDDNRPRILVLSTASGGNTPVETLIGTSRWRWIVAMPEYFAPGQGLPAHDAVFNAISDADQAEAALAAAELLLAKTDKVVVNHPAPLRRSTRLQMAAALARVPGVRTARMEQVARADLVQMKPGDLSKRNWKFPLLLRALGRHGGEQFLKVPAQEFLVPAVAQLSGKDILMCEHLPTDHPEGYRKYRWFWVKGEWFPVHRVVSRWWKVHGFSSDLAGSEEHRRREALFFQDPAADMGQKALTALRSLGPLLPFDVGGIDCDVTSDGELLVFEANATMILLPPESDLMWSYRLPPYEAARSAVERLLEGAVGRG